MPSPLKVLLIESLPMIRGALAGEPGRNFAAWPGGVQAELETPVDFNAVVAAVNRAGPDKPALAVVPLAAWGGREPGEISTLLLDADPALPVVLLAPQIPDAWRQWAAAHPKAPRLVAMNLPADLHLLGLLATMGRNARIQAGAAGTAGKPPQAGSVLNPALTAPVPLETGSRHSNAQEPQDSAGPPAAAALEGLLRTRTTELRHSEERFAAAFRAAPYPQAILNFETGQLVEANAAFCALTGFSQQELRENPLEVLQTTGLLQVLRGEPHPQAQARTVCRNRSGGLRHLLVSTQPTALGGHPHLMLIAQDITDRVQLEEQLRQAQKMGAMGQLAAGVAHDFNNILTIIQGHLSLQLDTEEFDPPVRAALKETLEASGHAATLTRQLLALSRCQLFEAVPVDLNAVIHRMSAMLKRLIGEHIDVEWQCGSGLPAVLGDVPGIEQVIMNLVLQARDAMPAGGRLRIATGLSGISASRAAQNPEAREGNFVRFSIVDTGHGMDQAMVDRLLEAFASPGLPEPETGTAMAAVHGIVKQHKGWIELFSEPGQGTAFFVYLPVNDAHIGTDQSPGPDGENGAGSGRPGLGAAGKAAGRQGLTVLLVEDEPAVRTILRQLLIHCGCSVLEAADAPSALKVWAAEKSRIHLLITDIVMPGGMTGHELAARLTDERPDLKVIYSSGYSASLFQEGQDLVVGRNFLPKPYDAASVVSLIRRVSAERSELLES